MTVNNQSSSQDNVVESLTSQRDDLENQIQVIRETESNCLMDLVFGVKNMAAKIFAFIGYVILVAVTGGLAFLAELCVKLAADHKVGKQRERIPGMQRALSGLEAKIELENAANDSGVEDNDDGGSVGSNVSHGNVDDNEDGGSHESQVNQDDDNASVGSHGSQVSEGEEGEDSDAISEDSSAQMLADGAAKETNEIAAAAVAKAARAFLAAEAADQVKQDEAAAAAQILVDGAAKEANEIAAAAVLAKEKEIAAAEEAELAAVAAVAEEKEIAAAAAAQERETELAAAEAKAATAQKEAKLAAEEAIAARVQMEADKAAVAAEEAELAEAAAAAAQLKEANEIAAAAAQERETELAAAVTKAATAQKEAKLAAVAQKAAARAAAEVAAEVAIRNQAEASEYILETLRKYKTKFQDDNKGLTQEAFKEKLGIELRNFRDSLVKHGTQTYGQRFEKIVDLTLDSFLEKVFSAEEAVSETGEEAKVEEAKLGGGAGKEDNEGKVDDEDEVEAKQAGPVVAATASAPQAKTDVELDQIFSTIWAGHEKQIEDLKKAGELNVEQEYLKRLELRSKCLDEATQMNYEASFVPRLKAKFFEKLVVCFYNEKLSSKQRSKFDQWMKKTDHQPSVLRVHKDAYVEVCCIEAKNKLEGTSFDFGGKFQELMKARKDDLTLAVANSQ